MTLERKDSVGDTTATAGTGTVTIAGVAVTGFRTFASALTNGSTIRYRIQNSDNSEWEVGQGVWNSGASTLTRPGGADLYASSNSGSLVNFSAGTKAVIVVVAVADFTLEDGVVTEAKQVLADNTTHNASTTKHGYLKKLSNVATEYMDGTGNWSTPAGGGVAGSTTQVQFNNAGAFGGSADLTFNDTTNTLSVGNYVAVPLGATSGVRFGGSAATDILLESTNTISGESGYVLQVAKGNLSGEMPLSASKAVFPSGVYTSDFSGPRLKAGTVGTGFAVTNAGASEYRDLEIRNLYLDSWARLKSYTVATLPSAATAAAGAVAYVTDSNQTLTAGIGTTVAAGGSNKHKVTSDGTNWIVG